MSSRIGLVFLGLFILKWGSRPSNQDRSNLFAWLMKQVHWKNLSWKDAQECAKSGCLDGLDQFTLKEVASLGQHGHCPGNCSRDAENMEVIKSVVAPEAYIFPVKMVF